MQEKDFENLDLPRMYLDSSPKTYFVYKNDKEHVTVEAESAHDALIKSEVESPVKVTNIRNVLLETVVNDHISAEAPDSTKAGEETPAAPVEQEVEVAAPPAQDEAPKAE